MEEALVQVWRIFGIMKIKERANEQLVAWNKEEECATTHYLCARSRPCKDRASILWGQSTG